MTKLAEEYYWVSGLHRNFDTVMSRTTSRNFDGGSLFQEPPYQVGGLRGNTELRNSQAEQFRDELIQLLDKLFTPNQLDDLIDFYRSPTGKYSLEKSQEIADQIQASIAAALDNCSNR